MRQTQNEAAEAVAEGTGAAFDEVVLLDTAGRLQVPQEYLERFNIHGRAHLEPVADGILIRPVSSPGPENRSVSPIEEPSPEPGPAQLSGRRRWWQRLRGVKDGQA